MVGGEPSEEAEDVLERGPADELLQLVRVRANQRRLHARRVFL